MYVKFRNKPIGINTLDVSKITAIVNNISKQKENQMKKYLNDAQISDFLKDIAQTIKTDANDAIYKSTIELLIQQYESNIKPIIVEELKTELKQSVTEQLNTELKQNVTNQLKTELKQGVTEQLKTELKHSVTEQLKTELKQNVTNQLKQNVTEQLNIELKQNVTEISNKKKAGKNNSSGNKPSMNPDMIKKMVAYKLMNSK